jgi:hypothetical protein
MVCIPWWAVGLILALHVAIGCALVGVARRLRTLYRASKASTRVKSS